jgi:hypothetical protein
MQFTTDAAIALCKARESMSKLGCLTALRKTYISVVEVDACVGERRVVSGVKVMHFISEDFKQEVQLSAMKCNIAHLQLPYLSSV